MDTDGKNTSTNLACQSNVPPNSDDPPDPGVLISEEESIEVIYPVGSQKAAGPGNAVQQAGMSRQRGFVLLSISRSISFCFL